MPVLLTALEEWDAWLEGSVEEAAGIQRPLPHHMLKIVAAGEENDPA
jgi:putative SOS response-associated peptidase YedK